MITSMPWCLKALLLLVTHGLAVYWAILAFEGSASAFELLVGGVLGYVYLDLMTVLTHWTIDNYFTERTPIIGSIVYHFREHHVAPTKMFERGYIDNNFAQCFIALPFLVAWFVLETTAGMCMFVAVGAFAACYITQIHKWAHQPAPPFGARLLQRVHLIVDSRHHEGHHTFLDRNYALCAGWVDHPVAWLRVLDIAQVIVYLVTGHTPINRGPNMATLGKTTFSRRLGGLAWKAWYRLLARYAARRGARFYCMNWGYEDGRTVLPEQHEERYPLQLYERALHGIELGGKRLVEISSGRGGGLAYLAQTRAPRSALGIDFVGENVRVSQQKFACGDSRLEYRSGEAEATGLGSADADVLLSIEASHCYPSFQAFLNEAHRVLVDGGRLVLADFRPVGELGRLRTACALAGFDVIVEADITAGVLEGMRRDAGRRQALINRHANQLLHRLLRNFAAADESAATYRRLFDGSYVYFLMQMRRRRSD